MLDDNTELLVCKQWSWLFCILKSIYVYIVHSFTWAALLIMHSRKDMFYMMDVICLLQSQLLLQIITRFATAYCSTIEGNSKNIETSEL